MNHENQDNFTLSPPDAAAVDALLENGAASAAHPASADDRTRRAADWLKILGSSPTPEPSANLAQKTLAAIHADNPVAIPIASAPSNINQAASIRRRFWTRRIGELAAMLLAAAMLIAVLIPAMNHAHMSSQRSACVANLRTIENAFATYAVAYHNALPQLPMPENHNWLHGDTPGAASTNTSHLLPLLAKGNLTSETPLYCPARSAAPADLNKTAPSAAGLNNIGYSYVNMFGNIQPAWDNRNDNIILADRNPLFATAPGAPPGDPAGNSPNHETGTNLLRADGSVSWETSPDVGPGNDNIWTISTGAPQLKSTYLGTERTASPADTFIAP